MPQEEHEPLLGSTDDPTQHDSSASSEGTFTYTRRQARRYLGTKWGHYTVIFLVTVDIGCIFADFMINLYLCEHECNGRRKQYNGYHKAQEALEIVSLVISCSFMGELLVNLWAFGFGYLNSWFHRLDATVILAGFILDVCMKGVLSEVGSTIVILRLWRILQIVEEFSAGASERMDPLYEQIEELRNENRQLHEELSTLKAHHGAQ